MITLTPGQKHDCPQAEPLLDAVVVTESDAEAVEAVLADKGYDSAELVAHVEAMEAEAVIPSRKRRKQPREHDRELYKERNKVERFFGRIKHYRRIGTRYEKSGRNYLAMLHLVSAMVWLL